MTQAFDQTKHPHILTFIIKSIYPVDGGTFMVSSEKKEVLWIFDLVGKQQADGLQ